MKTNFKNIKRAARRGHFLQSPSAFNGMVRLNVRNANGKWIPHELMNTGWATFLGVMPQPKGQLKRNKKHAHA